MESWQAVLLGQYPRRDGPVGYSLRSTLRFALNDGSTDHHRKALINPHKGKQAEEIQEEKKLSYVG